MKELSYLLKVISLNHEVSGSLYIEQQNSFVSYPKFCQNHPLFSLFSFLIVPIPLDRIKENIFLKQLSRLRRGSVCYLWCLLNYPLHPSLSVSHEWDAQTISMEIYVSVFLTTYRFSEKINNTHLVHLRFIL